MMRQGFRTAAALAIILVLPVIPRNCPGAQIDVYEDGSRTEIQDAIDAASDGDEILVHPGTYDSYAIHFLGKRIRVASTGGPDVTTIRLTAPVIPPLISFDGGETRETVLEGFTLLRPMEYGGSAAVGGAILISHASPTIRECAIRLFSASQVGGGLACLGPDSDALVEACLFRDCDAIAGGSVVVSEGARLEMRGTALIGGMGQWRGGNVVVHGSGTVGRFEGCRLIGGVVDHYEGSGTVAWVANGAHASFEGCTTGWNTYSEYGCDILVESATCELTACRILGWGDPGIEGDGTTTLRCCDVWGHEDFEWRGIIDAGGNFSLDPHHYCGVVGLEDPIYVRSDSPCAPGNHPDGVDCGLIGADGVGCDVPNRVEETTWGRVKSMYKSQR